MKLTMFDGGQFTSPAGLWREGEDMRQKARFPVPVYLVETGTERILIDTGLHPAAARDPARHYDAEAMRFFELEQRIGLEEQLDLSTLTKVVVTHLHFDHAGGLGLLPSDLPIYVQHREWAAGQDREAIKRNFLQPKDYAGVEEQVVLIDAEHDLLGDGSVQLLATTGHTPGHQSVRVGDRLVIGGDVTHYDSGLDDLRLPVFGDDLDAQRASARRLRAIRDAGVVVRPGHDPTILSPGPIPL